MKPSSIEILAKADERPAEAETIRDRLPTTDGAVNILYEAPWVTSYGNGPGRIENPNVSLETEVTFTGLAGRGGTGTLGLNAQMSTAADAGREVVVYRAGEAIGQFTLKAGRHAYDVPLDLDRYAGGPLVLVFSVEPDAAVIERDGFDIVTVGFSGIDDGGRYGAMDLPTLGDDRGDLSAPREYMGRAYRAERQGQPQRPTCDERPHDMALASRINCRRNSCGSSCSAISRDSSSSASVSSLASAGAGS